MNAEKRPELKRILTLGQLVLCGVTFVCPAAPFPMFGIVSTVFHGHMAWLYLVAMTAMVLTAHSYGRMEAVYPAAGSANARCILCRIRSGLNNAPDDVLMPLMSAKTGFMATVVVAFVFAAVRCSLSNFGRRPST